MERKLKPKYITITGIKKRKSINCYLKLIDDDSTLLTEISRLTMTGEQGTLDSSLGGNYMNKASNYGPAVFKIAELVSIYFLM